MASTAEAKKGLDAIEKMGTHAQKIDEYKKLAVKLFQGKDVQSLTYFLARLADDPPSGGTPPPSLYSSLSRMTIA